MKVGIVGAGRIAGAFADQCRASQIVKVTAVASRSLDHATEFASKHGLEKAFGSYQELFQQPDIDAVYIATPNSLHYEQTLEALAAGKHVLCEKPMATSSAHAREMFDFASKQGLVLLEGVPYRYQEQTQQTLAKIHDGSLGKVKTIYAGFGFVLSNLEDPRLDPTLGPGSLWDVGIYAVNFGRAVAGCKPVEVFGRCEWDSKGSDLHCDGIVTYENGITGHISSSFVSPYKKGFVICEGGTIEYPFHNNIHGPEQGKVVTVVLGEREEKIWPDSDGFLREAEAFARLSNSPPLEGCPEGTGWLGAEINATTPEETFENISTIEALLASAKSGRPTKVEG